LQLWAAHAKPSLQLALLRQPRAHVVPVQYLPAGQAVSVEEQLLWQALSDPHQ